jgi:hypothetical protein
VSPFAFAWFGADAVCSEKLAEKFESMYEIPDKSDVVAVAAVVGQRSVRARAICCLGVLIF